MQKACRHICDIIVVAITALLLSGVVFAQPVGAGSDDLIVEESQGIVTIPNIDGEWLATVCLEDRGCSDVLIKFDQNKWRIVVFEWVIEFWIPVGSGLTFGNIVAFELYYGCYPLYWGRVFDNNLLYGVMFGDECRGTWYATRSDASPENKHWSDQPILGGPPK